MHLILLWLYFLPIWWQFCIILTCYCMIWTFNTLFIMLTCNFLLLINLSIITPHPFLKTCHPVTFKNGGEAVFFCCLKCHPKLILKLRYQSNYWYNVRGSEVQPGFPFLDRANTQNTHTHSAGKACWDIQEAEKAERILAVIKAASFLHVG